MEPLMRDHPSFKTALWGGLKRGVPLYFSYYTKVAHGIERVNPNK
jgi:hypothetical protein